MPSLACSRLLYALLDGARTRRCGRFDVRHVRDQLIIALLPGWWITALILACFIAFLHLQIRVDTLVDRCHANTFAKPSI